MPVADARLIARIGADLTGRYTIVRELGAGASALVLLARDERHRRDVAIKVLRPEVVATIGSDRFLREIDVAAGLQHPNVVPIFDSGIAGGLPFLVMPFLGGSTLREKIRAQRQLTWDDTVKIAREVADALDYAHSRGVVHRDVKPGNILIADSHSYVSDFGLALAAGLDHGDRLTGSGIAVGTAEYMSPEQATADAVVDGRSDVYALGCVVYEMLVGEPPFVGRTITELVAQHLTSEPPPIRRVRKGVPTHVETAVQRALSKAAADRQSTARQFVEELEQGTGSSFLPASRRVRRRWARVAALAGLLAVGALAVRRWMFPEARTLDPRRVVVFPLRVVGAPSAHEEGQGDAVATYIGYALAAADPLKWIDGVRLATAGATPTPTTALQLSHVAQQANAAYYVDGDILTRGDSAIVRLALHGVAGDSVVARAAANGFVADGIPTLGVRALGQLLPALIDPGHRVDVSILTDRDAEAITSFLTGEREYRAMHFERALSHYSRAVAMDSAFAIAALKGAMANSWLDRNYGLELIDAALRHEQSLPRQYRPLAHGLRFARLGIGDSAVVRTREATTMDPPSSEAWQAYGDALYHQLPTLSGTDSLAETAYRRARDVDPQFTPALFHLAELSMRRGDLRYWDSVGVARTQGRIDSVEFSQLSHMHDCLAGRRPEHDQDVFGALAAGKVLAAGGAQPRCAKTLLLSALTAPSADIQNRWGALLALQSLLVATADTTALDSLLHAPSIKDLPTWVPLVLDAVGAGVLRAAADSVARDQGTAWPTMRASHVWVLGIWHTHEKHLDEARRALSALHAKRDSTHSATDSLFVAILSARLTLASGDTSRAISQLRAMMPVGSPVDIAWQPWQALAGERMLLAELLFHRGEYAGALRVASLIDALEPVVHLIYIRRSLELRAFAADRLRRPSLARSLRARLAKLASA